MFASRFSRIFNLFTAVTVLFLLTNHHCFSLVPNPMNASLNGNDFLKAVATWYGDHTGGGGSGGGCNIPDNQMNNAPYYGLTAAGSKTLYDSKRGCKACYEVRCTSQTNQYCSGKSVVVTITNECPGNCLDGRVNFDMSSKALGAMAIKDHDSDLRNVGKFDIEYRSAKCPK